ncbi:MAG: nicotinate-nucleotide adenylyltransferase, partial [Angelakisella sp.]
LHDITKEMPFEEQLNLCTSRGIITNYDGVTLQNLIHALSGAIIAREEFGAPEAVARAIARHTTGGDGMTLIDKIIFGADMAAYGRSYDGVSELRACMLESLDRGVLEALLRTEAHTAEMGWEAAPETLAGIEYMKKICTK